MKHVWRLLALTAGALVCVAPALADSPAGGAFLPVAHSALVTVEGAVASGTLVLRVLRTADRQPVNGVELALSMDGRTVPVTARSEGTWGVPLSELTAKPPGRLSIVVAHDGLREVLDGQLPGSGAPAPPFQSGNTAGKLIHKQMAWWILNVLVVLIGVIAVSRRMS